MRNALALTLLLVVAPSVVSADASSAAWKKYKGQIITSDNAIPSDYESDKAMIAGLKKVNKAVFARKEGVSTWTIYFMAFLNKKPPGGPINLVFYDVTGKKRTYVSNKEITIEAGSNILVADVEVSEEDGVKAGGKYEVVLGRKAGGRETVFAKTKLSFK